jgi:PAS domain S-box-containing protein
VLWEGEAPAEPQGSGNGRLSGSFALPSAGNEWRNFQVLKLQGTRTMSMVAGEIHDWLQTHLFDEVPIAISVISRDFQIVDANRKFRQVYGPWKGRPCYEVYKTRTERCEHCAAVETFADGKLRTREEEGTVRDGIQSHYLVHMVPIARPGGEIPYVIEMSTDITPVKQLEQQKREAERLAAVGETVAGIAHGIKNVLMGLEGGMYAVNSGIERADDERIARGWSILEENVARISEFVKEFLDFAKGRVAQVTVIDPNAPVRKVARLFGEKAAQAGIQLAMDLEERLAPAPLDEDGIYTCLANLVSNAIDACLLSDRKRKYVVTISSREEGRVLAYEVVDNGHGMDYEISRKVFSKFFTTKGSNRGTGLGLLTTKKIVHQHGGRISFTSREGEGSAFRIELPRDGLPKPGHQAEVQRATSEETA